MTSTIVPTVDLAPGMPSRIVTISATDVTEGGQSLEGQMVRFALSDTLDVSSGGDVIAKTQAEVILDANGEGSIRLPVYDEDVKTWCGDPDWAILVTATWGSQKAIRVPAGSSSIALSSLPPVRPLRGREKLWAITGVTATVTEGENWDVDAQVSGGIINFDWTVPPGAVAWWKGASPLSSSDDLDTITSGVYSVWSGPVAAALGLPGAIQGIIEVYSWGESGGVQVFRPRTFDMQRIWQRTQLSDGWDPWERVDGGKLDATGSTLTAGDNLDTLANGFYSVWSGATAEALGLPTGLLGDLSSWRWGAAGGYQQWVVRSSTPSVWIRVSLSGGWTDWQRIDAGAAPPPKARLLPASPATLKSTPLAFTTGYGGERISGSGTTGVIQYMPAQAQRFQIHMRNWNPRYTNSDRAPVSLTGVRIGRHTSNGNGADWIGVASGATEYRSEWLNVPSAMRGQEVVIEYTWSGDDVTLCLGSGWTNGSMDQRPPLFVWLELEVPAAVPVVAAFGSSTAAGVGATRPLIDSWLSQWCRTNSAVPAFWAQSGDNAAAWTETSDRKWELYGTNIAAPDALIYAMGSNDWSAGVSLQELQSRIATNVQEIGERITDAIFGTTITPRAVPPANDQTRTDLNWWMPRSGLFRDTFDFAGAVSLPDGTLDPAVDADGVHVTTAGHARLAAAITSQVVGEAVTYLGDGVYELS